MLGGKKVIAMTNVRSSKAGQATFFTFYDIYYLEEDQIYYLKLTLKCTMLKIFIEAAFFINEKPVISRYSLQNPL